MFNWLWKWFGWHVCEEFTRWERRTAKCSRLPTNSEVFNGLLANVLISTITFTKTWQERCCTICGKIQQRRLES